MRKPRCKQQPSVLHVCALCGVTFRVFVCRIRGGNLRFCSLDCSTADTIVRKKAALTQARLKEMLDYDANTGVFTWKKSPRHRSGVIKPGDVASRPYKKGYLGVSLDGRKYFAHRLAWLYVHGVFPEEQIDHCDRARSNNAIDNLRLATQNQNQWNTVAKRTSKTGVKGVWPSHGKFKAAFHHGSHQHVLGYFDTLEEGGEAYAKAAKRLHGEFIRLDPAYAEAEVA